MKPKCEGREGRWFAVSSCFWSGLTVFSRKTDGFTVPFFLNGFQISSQSTIRKGPGLKRGHRGHVRPESMSAS